MYVHESLCDPFHKEFMSLNRQIICVILTQEIIQPDHICAQTTATAGALFTNMV